MNCGITSLDGRAALAAPPGRLTKQTARRSRRRRPPLRRRASFPSLPRLRVLGLSDNAVSTGLGALAGACPLLAAVDLSNNKVKAVSELRALAPLRHLERLSVDGCPVGFAGGPGVSADQVRAAIFSALPTLRVLDGADAHGNEVRARDAPAPRAGRGKREHTTRRERGEEEGVATTACS